MEHMLAIGRSTDGQAVFVSHRIEHPLTHCVEGPQGAVVREGPFPVDKGMGVVEADRPDRGAPDMGDDRARKGPGRGPAKVFTVIRRPCLPFNLRHAIGIGGHSPAVRVTDSGLIFTTLDHKGILRVDEGTFDFGWLRCPESV